MAHAELLAKQNEQTTNLIATLLEIQSSNLVV